MKTKAFIFARGGSKGLPGKNIKKLGDLPLIAHSIKIAKELDFIDGIYVSTDSEEIAKIASRFGAEIIIRPSHLANDDSPEWHAWQHAINNLADKNEDFDIFLSLPATSPLRSKDDVVKCYEALDDDTDIVITATPASANPYFNMIKINEDGSSSLIINDQKPYRRQDAPPVYDMTGVAYVTRKDFILESEGVFSGRAKAVIIPRERAVDIDEEIDFIFAESIYNYQSE